MKTEYYIKYKDYYSDHIIIMGIIVVGLLLDWTVLLLLLFVFVFWFLKMFFNKNNREYIKKEYEEKKITKKEYDKNFKGGK